MGGEGQGEKRWRKDRGPGTSLCTDPTILCDARGAQPLRGRMGSRAPQSPAQVFTYPHAKAPHQQSKGLEK